MARKVTAYIVCALTAPLTFGILYLLVVAVLGPRHIFRRDEIWDLADFLAKELGVVMFMGALPALVFFSIPAWVIIRQRWSAWRSMAAGALGGFAYCAYAGIHGYIVYSAVMTAGPVTADPLGAARLPLFWFFGSYYGDSLAFGIADRGIVALLFLLPPIGAGMLAALAFHLLASPTAAEKG